jgi:hypothetical protein
VSSEFICLIIGKIEGSRVCDNSSADFIKIFILTYLTLIRVNFFNFSVLKNKVFFA